EVGGLVPAGTAGLVAPGAEELVAAPGVRVVEVEPDGDRVARVGLDDVGALPHVQGGLVPAQAVLRGGVAGGTGQAAHVPHLEEAVPGVVPDAVAADHRRRAAL